MKVYSTSVRSSRYTTIGIGILAAGLSIAVILSFGKAGPAQLPPPYQTETPAQIEAAARTVVFQHGRTCEYLKEAVESTRAGRWGPSDPTERADAVKVYARASVLKDCQWRPDLSNHEAASPPSYSYPTGQPSLPSSAPDPVMGGVGLPSSYPTGQPAQPSSAPDPVAGGGGLPSGDDQVMVMLSQQNAQLQEQNAQLQQQISALTQQLSQQTQQVQELLQNFVVLQQQLVANPERLRAAAPADSPATDAGQNQQGWFGRISSWFGF